MKGFIAAAIAIFVAVAAWRIGGRLSADAVGMAVGVLFGVLAGVPVALLMLASSRRRDDGRGEFEEYDARRGRQAGYGQGGYGGYGGGYFPQPPVIVVTGNQPMHNTAPAGRAAPYALPAPYEAATVDAREFKVVGEREGWIDEW